MELLLVRHAFPARIELTEGRADPGLTSEGQAEAALIARYLINRIIGGRGGQRSILTINETAHLRNSGLPMGLHQNG